MASLDGMSGVLLQIQINQGENLPEDIKKLRDAIAIAIYKRDFLITDGRDPTDEEIKHGVCEYYTHAVDVINAIEGWYREQH
jgi:hypothetical protein